MFRISLLPLFLGPIVPIHVHVAEEGAVHANVHGHGGGGVCVHGVYPPLLTVGGTGRWALMGGCEDRGIRPSEPKQEKKGAHTLISHFSFMTKFLMLVGLL